MKRRIRHIVAVLGIISLVSITPVFSQEKPKDWVVVDLNTLDCKSLLRMSGNERDVTVAFYHGIITGMNKETSINVPVLSEVTDKVVDHCIDNPKDILLKVFQEKRK
jgi:hypothetical protein